MEEEDKRFDREFRLALGNVLMEDNARLRRSAEHLRCILVQTAQRLEAIDRHDPWLETLRSTLAAESRQRSSGDSSEPVLMSHPGSIM